MILHLGTLQQQANQGGEVFTVDTIELTSMPVGTELIEIRVYLHSGTFDIDWGDGNSDLSQSAGVASHNYVSGGDRTVTITGSGLGVISGVKLWDGTMAVPNVGWRHMHIKEIGNIADFTSIIRASDSIESIQIDKGVVTATNGRYISHQSDSITDITIKADTTAVTDWRNFVSYTDVVNVLGGFSFDGATDMSNTFLSADSLAVLDAVGAKIDHTLFDTVINVSNLNTYVSNLGDPATTATLTLPNGRNKTELDSGIVSTAEGNGWTINPQS